MADAFELRRLHDRIATQIVCRTDHHDCELLGEGDHAFSVELVPSKFFESKRDLFQRVNNCIPSPIVGLVHESGRYQSHDVYQLRSRGAANQLAPLQHVRESKSGPRVGGSLQRWYIHKIWKGNVPLLQMALLLQLVLDDPKGAGTRLDGLPFSFQALQHIHIHMLDFHRQDVAYGRQVAAQSSAMINSKPRDEQGARSRGAERSGSRAGRQTAT